jgi:hypothetical protein
MGKKEEVLSCATGGALTGRSDAIRVSEKEEELVWGF